MAGSAPAAAGLAGVPPPMIKATTAIKRKHRKTANTLAPYAVLEITASRKAKSETHFRVMLPLTVALASIERLDLAMLSTKRCTTRSR